MIWSLSTASVSSKIDKFRNIEILERRHVLALKIVIGVALLGITGFNIAMRYPNNEIAIGITIAIYGGAGLAALPLMNELIVETTYPVGEATSTGVSMMASQLVAALLVALSAIVPSSGSDDYPDTVCRDGESQDLTWYLLFVNGLFILYYPFFVYFYRKFIQYDKSSVELRL